MQQHTLVTAGSARNHEPRAGRQHLDVNRHRLCLGILQWAGKPYLLLHAISRAQRASRTYTTQQTLRHPHLARLASRRPSCVRMLPHTIAISKQAWASTIGQSAHAAALGASSAITPHNPTHGRPVEARLPAASALDSVKSAPPTPHLHCNFNLLHCLHTCAHSAPPHWSRRGGGKRPRANRCNPPANVGKPVSKCHGVELRTTCVALMRQPTHKLLETRVLIMAVSVPGIFLQLPPSRGHERAPLGSTNPRRPNHTSTSCLCARAHSARQPRWS